MFIRSVLGTMALAEALAEARRQPSASNAGPQPTIGWMLRHGAILESCDGNGRFELAAVRPGEYYGVAATKEPRTFMDLSDDHLLQQASKLTVRSNETMSADIWLIER